MYINLVTFLNFRRTKQSQLIFSDLGSEWLGPSCHPFLPAGRQVPAAFPKLFVSQRSSNRQKGFSLASGLVYYRIEKKTVQKIANPQKC